MLAGARSSAMSAAGLLVLSMFARAVAVTASAADSASRCPCPALRSPSSRDCHDCRRVRCHTGAWALRRGCASIGVAWCDKAEELWVSNCLALGKSATGALASSVCSNVMDACGTVCSRLVPPQLDCQGRCLHAQEAAVRTCNGILWPEPPVLTTTLFPAARPRTLPSTSDSAEIQA